MKKLTAMLVLATALTLTACSAPETVPKVLESETGASAPASVTAAPIPAQAAAPTSESATGVFGDQATDAAYLDGVKDGWTGTPPGDDELVSAAKLACDEFIKGTPYREMKLVEGVTNEDLNNGIRIAVYASRNYCTDFNTDNN